MYRLLAKYQVGIFSSTSRHNLLPILECIFGKNILKQLLFIWDRSRTRFDPDYQYSEETEDHLTVKMLTDFWENPIFNVDRIWDRTNTLCLDHELTKLRFNPMENILLCQEWEGGILEQEIPFRPDSYQEIETHIRKKFDTLRNN
jgi:hypothetical protein